MNYKVLILNLLLERYENSKSYKEETSRRILIKAQQIKEYDIENFEEKNLFNSSVIELEKNNLIDFSWRKYEENNIIDEIWLNKEFISEAYRIGKRNDIKAQSNDEKKYLEKVSFKNGWLINFKNSILTDIEEKQKENKLLPYKYYKGIIEALKLIDMDNTYLERTFSIKCYNDSKYFEKYIKKYIVKIIKKYLIVQQDGEFTDEEILLEVGVSKYPEIIEFNGNIQILFGDNWLKYSNVTCGSYINSEAIKKIKNIDVSNINKVLFIENKANYIDYINNNQVNEELVVYHGGMYSPNKKIFFEKIYENSHNRMNWYHWSDIDLGGFMIFERLQQNIVPELLPYKMGVEEFYEKQQYWQSITTEYAEKLNLKLQEEKYRNFYPVIAAMLKENARLEQEAFLI